MENIVVYPIEDWFLQDPMPKYIDPRETPVIPWEYRKMLNPRYNLKEQALSAPEQIEKYGRVYQRISSGCVEEEMLINGVVTTVYYILYKLV